MMKPFSSCRRHAVASDLKSLLLKAKSGVPRSATVATATHQPGPTFFSTTFVDVADGPVTTAAFANVAATDAPSGPAGPAGPATPGVPAGPTAPAEYVKASARDDVARTVQRQRARGLRSPCELSEIGECLRRIGVRTVRAKPQQPSSARCGPGYSKRALAGSRSCGDEGGTAVDRLVEQPMQARSRQRGCRARNRELGEARRTRHARRTLHAAAAQKNRDARNVPIRLHAPDGQPYFIASLTYWSVTTAE